jgi:hypothetical protein
MAPADVAPSPHKTQDADITHDDVMMNSDRASDDTHEEEEPSEESVRPIRPLLLPATLEAPARALERFLLLVEPQPSSGRQSTGRMCVCALGVVTAVRSK